ncbi:MAG: CpXC domain-containing protein, partial [Anaerolineae bacterium]
MGLVTPSQITCPVCGTRYTAQVHQSVDAQKEPGLKQLLVQERLNVSTCPQCGNQVMVSVPVLYHDAEKSTFAVFIPMGAVRSEAHQQQLVGALTNRFMSELPPEERR